MSLWFAPLAATALIAGSAAPPAYVAPCPSGISGGLSAGYKRQSLLIGPLALYRAGDYARYPGTFIAPVRPGGRRFPPLDSAATVRTGGSVTLAVAPEDRPHVALLYDPRSWRHAGTGYTIGDGTAAVTLRGCTTPYTEYVGGFVLDGPRRVTLEAWIDGAAEPERRVVVFGG